MLLRADRRVAHSNALALRGHLSQSEIRLGSWQDGVALPRITGADKTDTHPSNTAQRFPHSSRVNNPVRRTSTPKASAGTTRIAWRESPNTLRLAYAIPANRETK